MLTREMDYPPDGQDLCLIVALDVDMITGLRQRKEIPLTPIVAAIIFERGLGWQNSQAKRDHPNS
ncbi:MAG TPA: hypothetical protein VID20_07470 [Sphingomicrobium sp.]|jgi:hypothetical protein